MRPHTRERAPLEELSPTATSLGDTAPPGCMVPADWGTAVRTVRVPEHLEGEEQPRVGAAFRRLGIWSGTIPAPAGRRRAGRGRRWSFYNPNSVDGVRLSDGEPRLEPPWVVRG